MPLSRKSQAPAIFAPFLWICPFREFLITGTTRFVAFKDRPPHVALFSGSRML